MPLRRCLTFAFCIFISSFCSKTRAQLDLFSVSAQNVSFTVNTYTPLTCTATVNLTLLSDETLLVITIEHSTIPIKSEAFSLLEDFNEDIDENGTIYQDSAQINGTLDVFDAGEYACTARIGNDIKRVYFNVATYNFQLTVEPLEDKNVSLHEPVLFECVFNHNLVHISWRKDNNPLTSISGRIMITTSGGQSLLRILSSSFDDMGTYTCSGRLLEYTNSTEAFLIIDEYVPLYINSERYNEYSTVMSNRIGAVNCDIEGVPTPTYTWSKESQMISSIISYTEPYVAENGSLIITYAGPSSNGNYTCHASQRLTFNMTTLSLTYNLSIVIEDEPIHWYIYLIAGIVGIAIVLMITIAIYFVVANTDIFIDSEKRRMKRMEKKWRKQLKSQETADDEFGFYAPTNTYDTEELWRDNELFEMTNQSSNEPMESPTVCTSIDGIQDGGGDDDDDEGYQGTFIRKHTLPSKKDKQPETKSTTLIDAEVDDSDENDSFDQGTFIRKKTPPSKRNETPSKGSSSKLPVVPSQETTVPLKDPTTQSGPAVQRNIPSSKEVNEKAKQEDDGSYYTETVYTPPPLLDYEDDDDDDIMKEELTRALFGKDKEDSSPVPSTHSDRNKTSMGVEETDGCESVPHTVSKDEVRGTDESEAESSYDLEKIMAQHAVATMNQPWPFKPLLSSASDAESDQAIKRTDSFSKQPQREAHRKSFDKDSLHGKYPSPPQGRRRSLTDKRTAGSYEKGNPRLARRMSLDGGQRRSYTEDFPRSQSISNRPLLDRHISEAPVKKWPGRDKRDDQSEVLLKRRLSDSHIQRRSQEAKKNSDANDLAPLDTLKLKKEADKEKEKKEKGAKKKGKRSKGASSLAKADVFY
ncbi:PREDICTED: uncharacterized protein LOC109587503 [Amphimedon queenslandica]|uniref:Ig-like domain-containing protein n=1 Tax=Amphimedon queenslandica TaxID=400682 RepID=A0AAN0JR40_AMPQE|nr:PREDICTED: uncharacterized protein LOC109587503 [Amphimedon queenslandica]|eukprot:XP_019859310.1 PREDICTED: uncharacterized protein LOC109587503 [Amphimedon queenslandica]